MMDLFKDRRTEKRLDSNIISEYKLLDDSSEIMDASFKKAKTINVSLGGLCMVTGSKMEPGSVIKLELPLGKKGKKVSSFCEVEWCRQEQDVWLVGFSFISLGEEDAQNLGEYIKTYN